jgi:histidyl-tRNA synthetase
MNQKLSNLPYKGCNDYIDLELKKLNYVFSKWEEVAKKYGFREYLTPVLEPIEIYEAKSGEDIKRELFIVTDSGNRRLTLRPEMTPSVSRLVTKIYGSEPKPIKLFSIANFFRGERPQKGRDREFWQLNMDIFGDESIYSDLEVLMSALDLMIDGFKAPKGSFILKLNNRKLINFFLDEVLKLTDEEQKLEVVRKLDKFEKLSEEDFKKALLEININDEQANQIIAWMRASLDEILIQYPVIELNEGFKETKFLMQSLMSLGYGDFIQYSTELIRGFDYYDGSIFEVFDLNPEFKRSLFGGGRYNGLAEIFGSEKIPAVGYAPGSPITFFLDNWNLWPNFNDLEQNYYLPILTEDTEKVEATLKLAQKLRQDGKFVEVSKVGSDLKKALSFANKRNFEYMVIFGENEMAENKYLVKDMRSGEQSEFSNSSMQ